MSRRRLGATELRISPIVFGSMARRRGSDADRIALIRDAVARGFTTIDTAPLYDFGGAERLLGAALRPLPAEQVQVLTKVGLRWDPDARGEVLFEFDDAAGRRCRVRKDGRPESVCREVEQSLERLGRERLDLVQIHHLDRQTPLAETLGALADLRRAGKIGEIGLSNATPADLAAARAALGAVPLCSLQEHFSLLRPELRRELLPACAAAGVGVLAYSPLEEGLLAGADPARFPAAARRELQQALTRGLQPVADRHRVSAAAVALAWTIAQPGVTAAIAGASTSAQLAEQAGALTLELDEDDLSRLDLAFSAVHWPRGWEVADGRLRRLWRRGRRRLGRLVRRLKI